MEMLVNERRRSRRIARHFILYARPVDLPKPTDNWDVSTVRNISKTGILFNSPHDYKLASKLEIKLIVPNQKKCACSGVVVRCLPLRRAKNIYEIATDLLNIEEESKKALYETIDFFIQREDAKI